MQANPISFDYYLVLDFEAQCIQNDSIKPQEIIEFPVVVVDAQAQKIVENVEFHHYIRPTVHTKLTQFCQELTKIRQEQVDQGITLPEALVQLEQFLKDNQILNKKFVFVTCGDWDLKTCLRNECHEKKIEVPEYLLTYINIKRIYQSHFNLRKQVGMAGMLQYLNLPLVGQHHSGIDDSRNIAQILVSLLKNGAKISENDVVTLKRY